MASSSSNSSSPSPHRVTNSLIKNARLRLRERARRRFTSSAVITPLQDVASVPEDSTVPASILWDVHEHPCSCGSPSRPTDPFSTTAVDASYPTVSPNVTSSRNSESRNGSSTTLLAPPSLSRTPSPRSSKPPTVHQPSPTSLFRVSSVGIVLSVPQMILPTLHDQCIVSDVNLKLLATDAYSPLIPGDSAWVLQELDLAAPWNLQLSHHCQLTCSFFIQLFIRL